MVAMHRVSLMFIKKSVPAILYLGGVAALMLADVVASAMLSVDDVAVWSRVRAITGILGVICLLGLDQFLLRYPGEAGRVGRILLVQIPLVAVSAALIGQVLSQSALMIMLISIFSSLAIAFTQFHRSRGRLLAAQISAQSWKIVFLFGIGFYAFLGEQLSVDRVIIICSILSIIFIFTPSLFGGARDQDSASGVHTGGIGSVYGVSLRLMAVSALTALSIYLEQLIVDALGGNNDAAVYFTHAIYFIFSASLLNGYLSFLAIPWAKRNVKKFSNIRFKWMWRSMGAAAIYVAAVQSVAILAWYVLVPDERSIDIVILIAFFISAWSRTVYTYPSAYFGAFGKKGDFNSVLARHVLSFLLAGTLFVIFWFGLGMALTHAVAWASAANWLFRTLICIRLIRPLTHAETRY